jgi:hypothetical protein
VPVRGVSVMIGRVLRTGLSSLRDRAAARLAASRFNPLRVTTTRIRETANEYGTKVAEYRCTSCGALFTVCPAPTANEDEYWTGCTAPECGSYDPKRDIDKWFDEGRVRSIDNGDGSKRLVPYRVIDGGKE